MRPRVCYDTPMKILVLIAALSLQSAMFRSDPAHGGVYASAPATLREVKWRFRARGPIISSPAVVGGKVYVGSSDGSLYAVSERTGMLAWRFKTKGPVRSSPAVVGDSVFFSSLDGNIYAVGATDGKVRWRFATQGERRFTAPGIHGIMPRTETMPDPFDLFLSSPTVADGVVYVGSGDRHVYALDAASGALRWKFETGNVVHATPAVSNGTVYIGSWDRYMYALDANTGAVRWKFQTGDDTVIYNQVGIASSAAVANGIVYFGCRDSKFYAVDARTGALRWKRDEHGSWVIGSPAIAHGNVYYTTSDERVFVALDAASGALRFTIPYGAFAFSSPSIAGNIVYFGSFDGKLYAADDRTGAVVGRFMTDGARKNLASHLNKAGNLDLRAIYPDGTLDGIVIGIHRIFALGSIVGTPSLADGMLFVGSTDGTLYAIS
jgi:eukaryotic-like serine/threonine-protein kinase